MNKDYCSKEGKRGLHRAPNWILWSFKTDSCEARMYVCLVRTSKEMHMKCDMWVCPVRASYVGIQGWCGDDVVALPPHIPMRCWAQQLRPDSTVWPYCTYHIWPSQARQKYSCTVQSIIGLWHLPPQMKNHGLNEEKTLYKKKTSIESSEVYMWLVWILTTKHKSLKREETCQEKYFTHWLFFSVNLFFRFDLQMVLIYISLICSALNPWLFIRIWMTLFLPRVWKDT